MRFHHFEVRLVEGEGYPQRVPVFGDTALDWLDRSARRPWSSSSPASTAASSSPAAPRCRRHGRKPQDRLLLSEQQAENLRSLVGLRPARAQVRFDDGLPMPRYGQGDDDRFTALPFIRWHDECGCRARRLGPGQPRLPRRLALRPRGAASDHGGPAALDDLKRGLPRGVAMLAPKSLADVLRKISPGRRHEGRRPGNRSGACWSFSFSLPAITLCATMLLMVVINLLNLFLGWLPRVFLALPRLCLKALRGK